RGACAGRRGPAHSQGTLDPPVRLPVSSGADARESLPVRRAQALSSGAADAMSAGCDLSVVVPVYKEEASIAPFLERMEAVLKSLVSKFGYWVISRLSDVQIPRDTGDFRLMTRRVIEELRALNETHGFLRGLVAYVGYRQTYVEYARRERAHGHGNYNRLV